MVVAGDMAGLRESSAMRALRTALYRFYFRAEKVIAPDLRSSQYAYYEALRTQITATCRWLDMGCGHQVFADWMTREEETVTRGCAMVVGIDLDWTGLCKHQGIHRRVYGDLSRLPFRPGAWDLISANMVMEHLENPAVVLRQVHDALDEHGTFVFHTPSFYHWGTLVARMLPDWLKKRLIKLFEGRVEEDVFPTHYRINTAAAIRRYAERCGFDVVRITHVSSSATLKMLGPIVLLELAYIRLISHPRLAQLRSGLVVTLRKRSPAD